ncbi:lysyl-tRNA synthetase [Buchnera aphidicola (Cinara tujafilina)]|uniref:Lysine--tRNA ligase n=1 Tax=Buchnera aphidicola (Cinara tujafilina) TaxID=261317 RepID=F7WZJ2_9GAMM|nr:lysine--tRNA ligase [Buchnera aphidicola]AEH39859.1 lysyl-tRNA synthetase [Buchnera aphidicola (Cinara tujafilina)]
MPNTKKYALINKKKILTENNIRKKKLKKLCDNGFNFPNLFHCNNTAKNILLLYKKYTKKELKKINVQIKIAGRIINKRVLGKASFFKIQDYDYEIQIYIQSNNFKKDFYKDYILELDLGDIISVVGTVFKTNTQEISIFCYKIELLTKILHPLPDKYHGLQDQELKYRKRYLDLIANNKIKKIFKRRSKILSVIRMFMEKKDFLEVETPMIHSIPGGANAKPFITYHNTFNKKMYLRVAPELYLKRLIIGGFNKIFEINRSFRNEGISSRHNPEFTMMEIYMAYSNYKDMMKLLIKLLKFITKKFLIHQKFIIIIIKLILKKIKTMTMIDAIIYFNKNIKKSDLKSINNIKKIMNDLNLKIPLNISLGEMINIIFEKTTEKKIIEPTFITNYPIEVSPLAKSKSTKNHIAERFEFFLSGYEIANGFSELNDSKEQKKRFKKQIIEKNNKKTSDINYDYDKEYISALEYGLPPTSGLGIGIDRLIMIFTNQKSIRDVILFPTLRSLKKTEIIKIFNIL